MIWFAESAAFGNICDCVDYRGRMLGQSGREVLTTDGMEFLCCYCLYGMPAPECGHLEVRDKSMPSSVANSDTLITHKCRFC